MSDIIDTNFEQKPPDKIKNIATALVKAQKAFGPALKTSTNPHFRSRYADLSTCIDAVIGGLNDNGITFMQQLHDTPGGVTVETVFIHETGEMLNCGKLFVPAIKQDAQGFGSALTYARRYSLMTACGIAPEDDDGNAANNKPEIKRSRIKQQEDKPSVELMTKYILDAKEYATDDVLPFIADMISSVCIQEDWDQFLEFKKRNSKELNRFVKAVPEAGGYLTEISKRKEQEVKSLFKDDEIGELE